jgi:hypothetical protein
MDAVGANQGFGLRDVDIHFDEPVKPVQSFKALLYKNFKV